MRWWRALPLPVRIAGVLAALVALGSAVLSWDALVWGAGELRIDAHLRWLYPIVVDGIIGVSTTAALALRKAPARVRAYVWGMLALAVGCSVLTNGAHSYDGNYLHAAGGTLPSAGLVATLHVLAVLARHARSATISERAPAPARAARRRQRTTTQKVIFDGRLVSPGHARKLRALARSAEAGA